MEVLTPNLTIIRKIRSKIFVKMNIFATYGEKLASFSIQDRSKSNQDIQFKWFNSI